MKRYSNKKTYFYVGIVLFFLIFFHFLGWLSSVEIFLRAITIPPLTYLNRSVIHLEERLFIFQNRSHLAEDYAACRNELQTQQVLTAQLKTITNENDELKKQLSFKIKQKNQLIIAEVVGKEINNNQQIIIINRGGSDGIQVDQPVIAGEGSMIGRVIKAEKDIALVLLINDSQSKVATTILNQDHSLGVVEGGYGISLRMTFIPRNETILVGDQIITSGLETAIPRGLLIGSVAAVENEAYKPFQQAILTPSVDLSKLTIVGVLLPN